MHLTIAGDFRRLALSTKSKIDGKYKPVKRAFKDLRSGIKDLK